MTLTEIKTLYNLLGAFHTEYASNEDEPTFRMVFEALSEVITDIEEMKAQEN